MNTSRFLAVLAALALTTGAAACSSSKPKASASASTTTTAASGSTTTSGGGAGSGASSGEVSATATATGTASFDGPVTGRIVCTHSSSGRLSFESQGSPQIELQVDKAANGTIDVLDQYKVMTGSLSYPAGAESIESASFQLDSNGTQYLATGGKLTLSDDGGSGTLDTDAAVPGQPAVAIHYKVVWKDCPAAS